jgi:hypothetical protein
MKSQNGAHVVHRNTKGEMTRIRYKRRIRRRRRRRRRRGEEATK